MTSQKRETFVHLTAGGLAGTAGAVVTCPLEVIKTRLQSSNPVFGNQGNGSGNGGHGGSSSGSKVNSKVNFSTTTTTSATSQFHHQKAAFSTSCGSCGPSLRTTQLPNFITLATSSTGQQLSNPASKTHKLGLVQCLKLIVEKEGPRALFKGLGPNIVGVAPSRAIYFCTYSTAKKTFNQMFPFTMQDSPIIHICSAASAGFTASTATNPIWFVKTRLQLHSNQQLTTRQVISQIYNESGIRGFYKGITASYMGISETVIHFVIYEATKKKLQEWSQPDGLSDEVHMQNFFQFMFAGAFSKTIASCIAYPHEVARTRLREKGSKYKKFWQTLSVVFHEEGYRGLYRGLGTQMIRQIPNTAIMMSTYELVVYLLDKYLPSPPPPPDLHDMHNDSEY